VHHRACQAARESLREVAAQRARCYVRRAAFGIMAHTPQALVFSTVQRSSAPPARAVDDDKLEHAAQAIRPSWPGAAVPTRRAVEAPTQDFGTIDDDEGPDENPFRATRASRRPWLLLVLGLAIGGGAWAYLRAAAPEPAAPPARSAAPAANAPAASPRAIPAVQAPQSQAPTAAQPQPTAPRGAPVPAAAKVDAENGAPVAAGRATSAQAGSHAGAANAPVKGALAKPAAALRPQAKALAPKAQPVKSLPAKAQPAKPAPAAPASARSAPAAVEPSTRLRVSDFDPPPAQAPRRAPSAVIRQNPYD
jgi:hypothetical protein